MPTNFDGSISSSSRSYDESQHRTDPETPEKTVEKLQPQNHNFRTQIWTELVKAREEVKTLQLRANAHQESLVAARAALSRKATEKADRLAQYTSEADAGFAKIHELEMALAEKQQAVQDSRANHSVVTEVQASKIKALEKELAEARRAMQECHVDRDAIEEATAAAARATAALQEARDDAKIALDHQATLECQVVAAEEKASKALQAAKQAEEAKARAEAFATEKAMQAEAAAAAAVAKALTEVETCQKIEEERVLAAQNELEISRLESQELKVVADQLRIETATAHAQQEVLIDQLCRENEAARAHMAALSEEHEKMQQRLTEARRDRELEYRPDLKETTQAQLQVPRLDLSDKLLPSQEDARHVPDRKQKCQVGKSPRVHPRREVDTKSPRIKSPRAKRVVQMNSSRAQTKRVDTIFEDSATIGLSHCVLFILVTVLALVVIVIIGFGALAPSRVDPVDVKLVQPGIYKHEDLNKYEPANHELVFDSEPTGAKLYNQALATYESGDHALALRMAHRAYKLDSRLEHSMLVGKIFVAKGLHAEAGKILSWNLDADRNRAYRAAVRIHIV